LENKFRLANHHKSPETEFVLQELASLIGNAGADRKFACDYPVIFIVGCARSGTTVLTQYLASIAEFCYPTNFLSRFYYNPYIGALLQHLMFDLDKKGELFGALKTDVPGYTSDLGKTIGALSPNEFWYYWRRFFKFSEIQKLSAESIKSIDRVGFLNGIGAIQHVFRKPVFMKAMILNWDIGLLAEIVPNSYFVFIERDISHNAFSLLQARLNFFGDTEKWYSFKPLEYNSIKNKLPFQQVVEQVFYTNKAIKEGLMKIPAERFLKISYESFCSSPSEFLGNLFKMLQLESPEVLDFTISHFNIKNKNSTQYNNLADWLQIVQYSKSFQ
jgi:hypothetical protein